MVYVDIRHVAWIALWFTLGYSRCKIYCSTCGIYIWDRGAILPPASEFVWLNGCICGLVPNSLGAVNGHSWNWTLFLFMARIGKLVSSTLCYTGGCMKLVTAWLFCVWFLHLWVPRLLPSSWDAACSHLYDKSDPRIEIIMYFNLLVQYSLCVIPVQFDIHLLVFCMRVKLCLALAGMCGVVGVPCKDPDVSRIQWFDWLIKFPLSNEFQHNSCIMHHY